MSNTIKSWLSAFRLRTLPLSLSGIIIGSCFAYYNGKFNGYIMLFSVLVTISLQILSNLANDYGDGIKGTDNANRIGPERAIQSGDISPKQMLYGIKLNTVIVAIFTAILLYFAFGSAYVLYLILFFILAGLSIYAAIAYTVGASPYGYRGLGDVFVFVFFGLLSVVGSNFLYTKTIDHYIWLPAICVGLLSMGVLNLNNMRDIESDKLANKETLAVKLGKYWAKVYHISLIALAIVLSVLFSVFYASSSWIYLFYIAFIPLLFHIRVVIKATSPRDFDPQLKVLALTTFLFASLLGIGYIL